MTVLSKKNKETVSETHIKSLDLKTLWQNKFLGEKPVPTIFPPSLSNGTTWTVSPREEAWQAGPNRTRVRTCSSTFSLNLDNISGSVNLQEVQRLKGQTVSTHYTVKTAVLSVKRRQNYLVLILIPLTCRATICQQIKQISASLK